MKRQFNPRFFLIGLAIIVALAGCVHLLHAFQVKRNASMFLRQADAYEKENNYPKAAESFERYVNLRPDDADAFCRYALALAKISDTNGQREKAYMKLSEAMRLQPERDDLRLAALKVAMAMTEPRYNEARTLAKALLAKSPNNADLLEDLAFCEDNLAKTATAPEATDAFKHYQAALTIDHTRIQCYVREARIVLRLPAAFAPASPATDAPPPWDAILQDMTKQNPGDYQAFLARAAFLHEVADSNKYDSVAHDKLLAEVTKDIEKAKELAPENHAVLIAVADDAREHDRYDEAQQVLEKGLKLYHDDPRFRFSLVQVYVHARKMKEASDLLLDLQVEMKQKVRAAKPKDVTQLPKDMSQQTIWALTDMLIDMGELDKAKEDLALLRDLQGDPGVLDYLEAHYLMESTDMQRYVKALALLEGRSRARLGAIPELARRADMLVNRCLEQLGNPDEQEIRLIARLRDHPDDLNAAFHLAQVEVTLGKLDEAMKYCNVAGLLNHFPEARLLYARILISKYLRESAESRAKHWDEVRTVLKPENDASINVLRETADYHQLEVEFLIVQALTEQELAQKVAYTTVINLDFGPSLQKLAAARKLYGDAENVMAAARKKDPREVRYPMIQASLIELKDRTHRAEAGAKAQALLEAAIKELGKDGERADLRMALLVRQLGKAGTVAEAMTKLQEVENETSAWPQTRNGEGLAMLHGLTVLYGRYNNTAKVKTLLEKIKKLDPADIQVRLQLFDLAVQMEEYDKAQEIRSEMRAIEGKDSPQGLYCDAYLFLNRYRSRRNPNDLNQARLVLAEVARRRPTWSRVMLMRGDFALLEGDQRSAAEQYRQAVMAGENRYGVVRTALELLLSQRRFDAAQQVAAAAQANGNGPAAQRLDVALVLMRNSDPDVLNRAEAIVRSDPTNAFNHIWLAQIALGANNKERAEKALRKAVELNPKIPETWTALIVFLATDIPDRKADAEKELDKASKAVDLARLPELLATSYEMLGKIDKAEEQYKILDKPDPKDLTNKQNLAMFYERIGKADKAEEVLNQLIACPQSNGLTISQIHWGRRALATHLAVSGDYLRTQKALQLLDMNNLTPENHDPEDERIRALINAVRPGERKLSIDRLEIARHNRELSTDQILFLVHLHELALDDSKAKTILIDLAEVEDKNNPAVLAYFIRFLLRTWKVKVQPFVIRQQDDLELAKEYQARLKKIVPDWADTLELEARLLAAKGVAEDVAKAVDLLKNWAEKDYKAGKDPRAFVLAATVVEELEESNKPVKERKKPETEKLFRRYVEEAGTNAKWRDLNAPLALVGYLGRRERLAEALDLLEKVEKDCKPDEVAKFGVAVLRANEPDPKQAQRVEALINRYLEKTPKSAPLLLALADLRDSQGAYDNAIQVYYNVLAVDEFNLLALNNCAFLLAVHAKKYDEALKLMKKATDHYGDMGFLLDTRGVIYLKMNLRPNAIRDFSDALAQGHDYGRWFHLAQAEEDSKPQEAANNMRLARKLGYQRYDVHPLEEPERQRLDKTLK